MSKRSPGPTAAYRGTSTDSWRPALSRTLICFLWSFGARLWTLYSCIGLLRYASARACTPLLQQLPEPSRSILFAVDGQRRRSRAHGQADLATRYAVAIRTAKF